MIRPIWILEEVAYAVHSEQVAEHGGPVEIRDKGLLESALVCPKNLYHYKKAKIPQLAAAYAYHLIRNHPFIDGNKRTAYVIARLFLVLNGYDMKVSQEERIVLFLKIASGKISEKKVTDWFNQHCQKIK